MELLCQQTNELNDVLDEAFKISMEGKKFSSYRFTNVY